MGGQGARANIRRITSADFLLIPLNSLFVLFVCLCLQLCVQIAFHCAATGADVLVIDTSCTFDVGRGCAMLTEHAQLNGTVSALSHGCKTGGAA